VAEIGCLFWWTDFGWLAGFGWLADVGWLTSAV
jgi:hypothetical protein